MSQRPSGGSNVHRTSSSDSDPSHNRMARKVGERRPLRASTSDSLNQKKLGGRIADLETQLGQAQQELKVLKGQLASAEAAKKDAQQQLKRSKKPAISVKREAMEPKEAQGREACDEAEEEKKLAESEKSSDGKLRVDAVKQEHEKPLKNVDHMKILKAKLEAKEKELEHCHVQNEDLKRQLSKASSDISSNNAKQEEMSSQLSQLGVELESSRAMTMQLNENLEAANDANKALEAEIKTMRVQTEQWRKAADAAAAVLAGEEVAGRIPERCGSMEKHIGGGIFQTSAVSFDESLVDGLDEAFRKPKGSGMKLSDLWKKKT